MVEQIIQSSEALLSRPEVALALFRFGAVKIDLDKGFKTKIHEADPQAPYSPIYYDLRLPRSDYELRTQMALQYFRLMQKKGIRFDFVADIPTGTTPYATLIADRAKVGMLSPRIDKKYGQVDGMREDYKGKRVLLVDDVITGGDSKFQALEVCKNAGLVVSDIVVFIDREQGGKEALKNQGINLHSVVKQSVLLKYYVVKGIITKAQYEEIYKRLEVMNEYIASRNL